MLSVRNLQTKIHSPAGLVHAVNDISFSIKPGETLGIVGESGSGKSVLAHSIMQLNPRPETFYPMGEVVYEDVNLLALSEKKLRKIRGKEIAMIFQDPMSGLNPVFTIGYQLIEAIRANEKIDKKKAKKYAIALLEDVGIPDPKARMKDYPHQFSGGMRQRALIAIALAGNPKLLIADEPTTALDVTVQANILTLLQNIQEKYKTAIIFISHDLGVISQIADRVLVMYGGRIVEEGAVNDIFYRTAMPYTWSLIRSIPRMDESKDRRLVSVKGQPPSLINPPSGCDFYARCPFRSDRCLEGKPTLRTIEKEHKAACMLPVEAFQAKKEAFQMTAEGSGS